VQEAEVEVCFVAHKTGDASSVKRSDMTFKLNHTKESDNVSLLGKYPSAPGTKIGFVDGQAKNIVTAMLPAAAFIG
jgi:hypothetical protein